MHRPAIRSKGCAGWSGRSSGPALTARGRAQREDPSYSRKTRTRAYFIIETEGFLHSVAAVSRSETKGKVGRHFGRNDTAFWVGRRGGVGCRSSAKPTRSTYSGW